MFLPNSFTLTSPVHEAMRMVAKASDEQPDRFANQVLQDWLMSTHPKILEYIRARDLAEAVFEQELHNQLIPKSKQDKL